MQSPDARLTVIGCTPNIDEQGVEVVGFLDKGDAAESARFDAAFREATIFCMPSYWESIGIVYMEAALYGLPIVMLAGQGREETFPPSMAVALERADAQELSQVLHQLAHDVPRMQTMGSTGRSHVLEKHTWTAVADRVVEFASEALNDRHGEQGSGKR